MSGPTSIEQLRRELADALCAAQSLPVPRSELHKMLVSLLSTAFAGLDDDSGIERARAGSIAQHALRQWHLLAPLAEQAPLSAVPS